MDEERSFKRLVIDSVFCQDYNFHGFNLNFSGFSDVEYDRIFCWIDINEDHLENKKSFQYEIITSDEELTLKGPFVFKSNIIDDEVYEHKVITYGDTDAYERGMKTLDRMKEEEYDLLVLLGDYAYDIFDDNGQKGDDFFELMEPILTKAPFVLTPGNHETADDSLMLLSRFQMPGTSKENHAENNYYTFIAGKVLYVSMNLDYAIFTDVVRIPHFAEQMYLDLKEKLPSRGTDWHYLAFFTHRPFHCVERAERSIIDLYYSNPILSVLNDFDVDMILTGHTHDFELNRIFDDYMPTAKSDNTLMIISGAAGTDKDPMDSDKYYNMPFNEEYIPDVNGLVELRITKSDINGKFFRVEDRKTLYSFDIKGNSAGVDIFMILAFVLLALIVIFVLGYVLYNYILDDEDEHQEVEKQTDRSKSILDEEDAEKKEETATLKDSIAGEELAADQEKKEGEGLDA